MPRRRRRRADATGRSVGECRHVRLYAWMMASPAWKSLTCEARALLVELYALYHGANNGQVFMSAREAARRLGIGKTAAWKALNELADKGFARPHVRGTFTLKARHATSWVLEEFEYAGQPATKAFMRWRPAEIQNTVRPRGQSVPPSGQIAEEKPPEGSICT